MTFSDVTNMPPQDGGAESLSRFCDSPMPPGGFLELAVRISKAIGELHRHKVIHKNVTPHTILVNPTTGAVTITDFSIASHGRRQHAVAKNNGAIEGTLAYMSPEQTGRISRVVDHRTDLYSLGMTFYQMLTGTLPFRAGDALEWAHCHIARAPRPPDEIVPGIPRVISAIIMKLLAKAAEERYQTAHGLTCDLEKCLDQWSEKQDIGWFTLGECDVPDQLLIPQKLYGRNKEIDALVSAFDRVVKGGTPELVMVAGYSGIGKTALVRELCKPVLRERGYFVSGKSDQYKRNIPYSTIAEAFRELIQQILTESDQRVAVWKRQLQSALGLNGQLVVEVVPQVELIIGKQLPVPELPPAETQNRFNTVFGDFVAVFAKNRHPLVVFLDDLQWVDAASLKLLEHIITSPDVRYLLLMGAYRDNEVGASHPLLAALENILSCGAIVRSVTLPPLSFEDLNRLNADTFRSDKERVAPLTKLTYEKTAGNPFFVIQFLTTLYGENLVEFDRRERGWKWHINHIRDKGYTDNVVDLMAAKLKRLSPETQMALKLAACIGAKFELHTLAIISNTSDKIIQEALWGAIREGLILPLGEDAFMFLHDRVQQVAYSLIGEELRAGLHVVIGRLLLESADPEGLEERVFDIVDQLNRGPELILDREERYKVAELNLMAGKKSKGSTAYASALDYLSMGARLLGDRAWDERYDLAFELHKELAMVEYLNSSYAHSKELIDLLLSKARTAREKAQLYNILIVQYTVTARYQEAIESGRTALGLFNAVLPEVNLQEALNAELLNYRQILGNRKISSLANEPEMSDPEQRIILELLSNTLVPARYTDSLLFALLTVMNVNLSLRFGPTPKSSVGYTAYGMFLGSKMNNYREGYEFGELAFRVSERFHDLSQKCQACFVLGNYLSPWVKHLKWADDINSAGYEAGLASGEMQWTGYLVAYRQFQPFYRGAPLDFIQKTLPDSLAFTEKTKNQWAIDTLMGLQLALSDLQEPDKQRSPVSKESTAGSHPLVESEYLARCQEHKSFGAIGRYRVLKAQILYLYGRMDEALDAAMKARELLQFFSSSISVEELNFYTSLILAALYDNVPDEKKAEYLGEIRKNQEQMKIWADTCEENFKRHYLLVEAEMGRIRGEESKSMPLYEQAIQSARENDSVQDEGLSYELAARFYEDRGLTTISNMCLREARGCYVRWGAGGKVSRLERRRPWLHDEERGAARWGVGSEVGRLDSITVVKASQAISGEIVLTNLLQTLMRIALESAGAQRGCLVLTRGEELAIEAEATVEGRDIQVRRPVQSQFSSVLPLSMINYVRRTRENVILDDASGQNMFSSDEYIIRNRPVSVMCLPILRQACVTGLLYLENNLATGAFTEDRIAVLELIASQAAISLENATLYQGLRRAEEKYRGIYENIMEGIFQTTPDGRFVSANPTLARMLGYDSPEELMEIVTDVDHQVYVDPQRRFQLTRLLRSQGSARLFELQAYRKDGDKIWLSLAARAVRDPDGTLLYYEGSAEDVTERKQAEEERARLAAAIEQAAEGIIITDTEWIVQYANPAFERMSGFDESEIIGQNAGILESDKHDKDFYDNIRRTLTGGEVWSGRLISTRKNGTYYEAEVTGSPVRDKSGAIINHVSIHRDITHEVNLERELRQSQKMEAIGTLAGGIAHDFNNILMAITGYAQLARSKTGHASPVRPYLDHVIEASLRASNLVKQILTFSRRSEQELKPVSVAPILRETLKLLRSSLPSTIEIRQDIVSPAEKAVILADPIEIHQVLMNLCANSAHTMRFKGGILSVRLSQIALDASAVSQHSDLAPGPYVRLTVGDTGHGMNRSVLERIFDPYFTTKGPGEGTGLGLSVVQGIVKSHGGAITVDSNPEDGTTFGILLPRLEGQITPEDKTVQTVPTGNERLLFVDDEQILVDLGKEMLESLGYRVTAQTSSLEALIMFRAQPEAFDLVITDMTMPGLTGRELAKELMGVRPDLPVILCTGFSELINGKQAIEGGIREFVMKPYVISNLAQAIRRALEGRQG